MSLSPTGKLNVYTHRYMFEATVEQLKLSIGQMFVAVSALSGRLTMVNFTSLMMAFLLFEAQPSEKVTLCLGAIMKGIKILQPQRKRNRITVQQSNMAYNQELINVALCKRHKLDKINGDFIVTTNRRRSGF